MRATLDLAMAEIKKVSVRHEAIMEYMLINPAAPLREVAQHFDVTQAWLSTIIHSDAFQAKLAEKKGDLFSATIVPLREKILGVAHMGVEKLGEAMEHASPISDKDFIADTTDNILKNLGYTPKSAPAGALPMNQQNNYYVVDSNTLAQARARMQQGPKELESQAEGVTIEQREDTPSEGV